MTDRIKTARVLPYVQLYFKELEASSAGARGTRPDINSPRLRERVKRSRDTHSGCPGQGRGKPCRYSSTTRKTAGSATEIGRKDYRQSHIV